MSAQELTLRARIAAEELMQDTCTAARPTGGLVTNPDTGVDEPASEQVYEGPCKIQTTVAQAASPEAGSHTFTVENLQLHFPVSSELQTGDLVTITGSWDPQNVNKVFRLGELARGTYRTADRWKVELVTA